NKGLNIFNDKLVLASPDSATDQDYELIESVVAHEYFHNWTGNRITCRDWFQLCLKEGLTVYRDQEFSADQRSRGVQRIMDVKSLRARQFREDGGPLAHPVRPDSYQTIDNFYTATVYEKGAELCRMLHTILGAEGFRKGMDLYFQRHDGTAATVEDFAKAFEDATGSDLTQFRRWWAQAGTPTVKAEDHFDASSQTYTLTLSQDTKPTPGQPDKLTFHIPVRIGLLGGQGQDLALHIDGQNSARDVLMLTESSQTFRFKCVTEKPVPSVNRGFSAPVNVEIALSEKDRQFLLARDSDAFNRWDAGQQYGRAVLIEMARQAAGGATPKVNDAFVEAFSYALRDARRDPEFASLMLMLPITSEIVQAMDDADPDAIFAARMALMKAFAQRYRGQLEELYHGLKSNEPYSPNHEQAGKRSLRNTCLRYLTLEETAQARTLAAHHYNAAGNMTDAMAGLAMLADMDGVERTEALGHFEARWRDTPLVLDKWFSVQALSCRTDTLASVKALCDHPAFTRTNPNRVRSLTGTFAANVLRFNAGDGSGYDFVASEILAVDPINPQVAARLAGAFEAWRRFEPKRRAHAKAALERIVAEPSLSTNTREMASRTLG
ncbi:MAG TPA: aminopeptidase N, partial [Alphaproteobacteria bacterium]|nr:aminopeptidase N [Alphaproteobacteria bacterium]